MRYYRRGEHHSKKQSLTVDNVLCKVKRPGHLSANGKYLCFHNMTIKFPGLWPGDETQIVVLL